jgi:hypothetical protein
MAGNFASLVNILNRFAARSHRLPQLPPEAIAPGGLPSVITGLRGSARSAGILPAVETEGAKRR